MTELLGGVRQPRWSHLQEATSLYEGWSCHTSLLPRPKPLITGPRSFSGKGACGVSGPAMGSRVPVGRTIVLYRRCEKVRKCNYQTVDEL